MPLAELEKKLMTAIAAACPADWRHMLLDVEIGRIDGLIRRDIVSLIISGTTPNDLRWESIRMTAEIRSISELIFLRHEKLAQRISGFRLAADKDGEPVTCYRNDPLKRLLGEWNPTDDDEYVLYFENYTAKMESFQEKNL